jgi:hypothetical protein
MTRLHGFVPHFGGICPPFKLLQRFGFAHQCLSEKLLHILARLPVSEIDLL